MTRTMGDAIHDNVSALVAAGTDMVAGYVTGTPDILWTAADWARFGGKPTVTIDQGYQSPPITTATVRDVEDNAWTPAAAVDLGNWQLKFTRRTIYCNRSNLPTILALGWRGDLWLAFPGWQPGESLPPAPGCTYVAVQNQLDVNNAYDLSVVLDPTWPNLGDPMSDLSWEKGWRPCTLCSILFNIANGSFGWANVCVGNPKSGGGFGPHQSGTSGTVNTYALTVDGTTAAGS